MNRILPSDKIYISQSKIPKAERGVFARVVIKKGELIERCPVIHIPEHDSDRVNESNLVEYIYYLGENKDQMTLTLGFGSIYNHAYSPNAEYKANLNKSYIDFVAIKNIEKDDEITVNYNQGSLSNTHPLWFEIKK